MPSFLNGRTKTKRKVLALDILAFSFLYIFSVALIYLLWNACIQNDIRQFVIYLAFYLIFLGALCWVIRDIHRNYDYFIERNDMESIKRLESIHFLCADPLCPRCGGWYIGLGLSLAITAFFATPFRDFLMKYPHSGIVLILLGCLIFILATPIHASMNFLEKLHERTFGSKRLKLLCGLISGLSLFLVAVGILILMQGSF